MWLWMFSPASITPSLLHTHLHLDTKSYYKDKRAKPGNIQTKEKLFWNNEYRNGKTLIRKEILWFFLNFFMPLKMGQIGCPETSVNTNLRCVTSQKRSHLNRGGSLNIKKRLCCFSLFKDYRSQLAGTTSNW
jgi:hypothetical protein